MAEVLLRCPHPGCRIDFEFFYDPSRRPFTGTHAPTPFGECPNGHRFAYTHRSEESVDRWRSTAFSFDYELTD